VVFPLYFLNVFHTRHHFGGQLYQHIMLRRFTEPFYDFIDRTWGYYPKAWREDHHVKHHVYTNESEIDNTVPAVYPLIRSLDIQPRHWFHKFQTFYWPFLTVFAAASFPLNNVAFHGGSKHAFLCWFTLMFVMPIYLNGWVGLGHAALVLSLAGGGLAYVFAVSHTHSEIDSSSMDAGKYENIDDWLKCQVEESMSWGGYAMTFLLGGINMQIEHHICPALEPPLYHLAAPEIRRICLKHGIRYTSEPSFISALWQFHLKLWRMG
jgi:linoleoyl-CoA desaturase